MAGHIPIEVGPESSFPSRGAVRNTKSTMVGKATVLHYGRQVSKTIEKRGKHKRREIRFLTENLEKFLRPFRNAFTPP